MNKIKLETEVLKRSEGYYTEIGLNELMNLGKILTNVKEKIGSEDFTIITEMLNENLWEVVFLARYIDDGGNIND